MPFYLCVCCLHVCMWAFIEHVNVIPESREVRVILNRSWLCSAWWGTNSWKTMRDSLEVLEPRAWITEWPLMGGEHLQSHREVPRRKPTWASVTGKPLAACLYQLQQTGRLLSSGLSPGLKFQAASYSGGQNKLSFRSHCPSSGPGVYMAESGNWSGYKMEIWMLSFHLTQAFNTWAWDDSNPRHCILKFWSGLDSQPCGGDLAQYVVRYKLTDNEIISWLYRTEFNPFISV